MKPNEFFRQWKNGIKAITPYQMVKINIMGSIIILLGIIIGLATTFINGIWWLFIILIGSGFLAITGLIATIQKYFVLSQLNKAKEEHNVVVL